MAQKVTVTLEDDLDGDPAQETIQFGIGGADYEIDLSKKHANAFDRELAPLHRTCPQGWQRTTRWPSRPRQAGSAAPTSGRGPRTRASRSSYVRQSGVPTGPVDGRGVDA
jgi:hypothetical protein